MFNHELHTANRSDADLCISGRSKGVRSEERRGAEEVNLDLWRAGWHQVLRAATLWALLNVESRYQVWRTAKVALLQSDSESNLFNVRGGHFFD